LLYETLNNIDCYTDECPFQKVCENYCSQYNLTLCDILRDVTKGGINLREKLELIKNLDVDYLYVLTQFLKTNPNMTPVELEKLLVGVSYEFGESLEFTPDEIFDESLDVEAKCSLVRNKAISEKNNLD
jgi:hypothetical protein